MEDTSQSSAVRNSTQTPQPTSPTNGVTSDPLKTTSSSSVARRQNPSENSVPNETTTTTASAAPTTTTTTASSTTRIARELPVTPNRSDDDKGEKSKTNSAA